MFCRSCEQTLSKDESDFSARLMSDEALFSSRLVYEDWLLRFAAGLMLRTIVDHEALGTKPHRRELERAKTALRDFLRRDVPTGYSLLRVGVGIQDLDRAIRTGIRNLYEQGLTAGCSWGVNDQGEGRFLAVYAQIPFHVFWMPIVPKRVKKTEWQNVKIHRSGVFDANDTQVCPPVYHQMIEAALMEVEPMYREANRRAVAWVDEAS